jgi:hypothetical protein
MNLAESRKHKLIFSLGILRTRRKLIVMNLAESRKYKLIFCGETLRTRRKLIFMDLAESRKTKAQINLQPRNFKD